MVETAKVLICLTINYSIVITKISIYKFSDDDQTPSEIN